MLSSPREATSDERELKAAQGDPGALRAGQREPSQETTDCEDCFLHGLILEYRPVPGLIPFTPNAVLTDIVRRVERDELKPNPRHITELRLN